MKMNIKSIGDIQNVDSLSEGLSIARPSDKVTLIVSLVSFLIACAFVWYGCYTGGDFYGLFPLVTLPLFICGGFYILRKKWFVLIIIVVVIIVLALLNVSEPLFYIISYALLGAVGTVELSNSIQRSIFFKIIRITEKTNVKQKLTIWDKTVAFLFNIPPVLDTRNINIDHKVRRSRIPLKDMVRCIMFCLGIGMIVGIYLSGNPAFMQDPFEGNVMLHLLSIAILIPVVVIPWLLFRSVNVRFGTGDNVFKLYDGLISTLYRMAVPLFLLFLYMLIFVNSASLSNLFLSIICSALMIAVIAVVTSAIYYMIFESPTTADINTKWVAFHPVKLSAELNEKERSSVEDLPGTPTRDETDIGDFVSNK